MNDADAKEIEVIAAWIEAFFQTGAETFCGKMGDCVSCCSGCAASCGGFDCAPLDPSDKCFASLGRWDRVRETLHARNQFSALKAIYGWDRAKGFLSDKGCRLPRTERSCYCQQTQCKPLGETMRDKNWTELYEKLERLKDIRKANNLLI